MSAATPESRLAGRSKSFALPESRMRSLHGLPTGWSYRLRFTAERHISAQLFDHHGQSIIPKIAYVIVGSGGARFEGETDAEGCLLHENVPKEDYSLELRLQGDPKTYRSGIPWVLDKSARVEQRIKHFGQNQLHVKILDGRGQKPIPDIAYLAVGEGVKFRGKTGEDGVIRHPNVPIGCYSILLTPEKGPAHMTRVPSVTLDHAALEQRVLGLSAPSESAAPRALRARLFDHFGAEPLANLAYAVRGADGSTFSGTTDAQGGLVHEEVAATNFVVEVEEPATGKKLSCGLPWVEGDKVVEQRVRGFGKALLWARLFDSGAQNPLSQRNVQVLDADGQPVFQGTTAANGQIGPKELPTGVYQVRVEVPGGRWACTRLPTVEEGQAPIDQRVLNSM